MKREYDSRNKRNFIIILGLSIIIIIIFSLFIYRYIHASKIQYKVAVGNILMDANNNYIDVSEEAWLKVRWNDNYYLDYQDNKVNLGKNVIVYNSISNEIGLYGKFYEIQSNGNIVNNYDETILSNPTDTKFFKIGDRKYLLVDRQIVSSDRSISADNYLLVELDKMGNAKLTNSKLNLKTITPTVLATSKYTFDMANEILKFGNQEIDLKKIIGSTNQYDPKINGGGEGSGTSTSTAGANQGQDNQTDNQVGGGDGEDDNQVVIEIPEDPLEKVTMDELKSKVKMSSVMMLKENLTSLDIDYVIYDPYNEYKSVFVEVVKSGSIDTVHLSKADTHIVIDNLAADTDYKLNFIYTTIDYETGETKQTKFDEIDAHTKKPVYSGSIYKVSTYSHKLTYLINLQSNYSIDRVNATVVFYYNESTEDGLVVRKKEEDVVVNVSGNPKTVTGVIDITGYDIIDLKNAKVIINSVSGSNGTITF